MNENEIKLNNFIRFMAYGLMGYSTAALISTLNEFLFSWDDVIAGFGVALFILAFLKNPKKETL